MARVGSEARDSYQPFSHEEQLSPPLPLDGTDRTKQTAVGRGVFYFRFLYQGNVAASVSCGSGRNQTSFLGRRHVAFPPR